MRCAIRLFGVITVTGARSALHIPFARWERAEVRATANERRLSWVSGVLIATMLAPPAALAEESAIIRPTIPGTSVPDQSRAGSVWVVRDGVARPTIPGTSAPDYRRSAPAWAIRDGVAHPTIPGTQAPDYRRPGVRVEPYPRGRGRRSGED